MEEVATREILWNVNTLPNIITMYAIMVLSMIVGFCGLFSHAQLIAQGKEDPKHLGSIFIRFGDAIKDVLFQKRTIREKTAGFAHSFIYIGFIALLFTTTMVFIDNDLGIRIYQGDFYLAVTLLSDTLGFGVLIGLAIFAHRRYVKKSDLIHNQSADKLLLSLLALLIAQGFILEALRIHHGEVSGTPDKWALYSPVGYLLSKIFWSFSANVAKNMHFIMWWFHSLTVFFFIAVLPYTKFLHIIASSANLYFRRSGRVAGALKSPGDIEKMVESGQEFAIGLGTIKDYTWKQLLDLDSCTSCGRCQEVCPAYVTNKPLSPKWMILDTRNHALSLHADGKFGDSKLPSPLKSMDNFLLKNMLLFKSGLVKNSSESLKEGYHYQNDGKFRAKNELVQKSALNLGSNADQRISGEVMSQDVFWSCTTCMACVEACPVGINHVEQIVENRRNMVLMQGEVPTEAQKALKALENRGNPYGPPQDRINWIEGLDVPILKAGEAVDYLYWVGCVSAFDKRKQKIARSLVTIM
ncbi:MAG: (Fe-S)-binding protein [bacterium]|nr:(Fe-S)-binding protein [bacterium]